MLSGDAKIVNDFIADAWGKATVISAWGRIKKELEEGQNPTHNKPNVAALLELVKRGPLTRETKRGSTEFIAAVQRLNTSWAKMLS